jgi:hypothetical protein
LGLSFFAPGGFRFRHAISPDRRRLPDAVVRWQHRKGRIFTRIRRGFSPNTQIRQARDPRPASRSEIICVFGVNLLLICVRILLFVPGRRLAVGRLSSHKLGRSYQRSSPAIIVVDVLAPQTERFGPWAQVMPR